MMQTPKTNPAALAGANRVLNSRCDAPNTNEVPSDVQAVRSLMRRFPISVWHARTVCELYGLGGAA